MCSQVEPWRGGSQRRYRLVEYRGVLLVPVRQAPELACCSRIHLTGSVHPTHVDARRPELPEHTRAAQRDVRDQVRRHAQRHQARAARDDEIGATLGERPALILRREFDQGRVPGVMARDEVDERVGPAERGVDADPSRAGRGDDDRVVADSDLQVGQHGDAAVPV